MSKIFNFQKGQPLKIVNKSAAKAEILIYGSIGESWFGDSITAKQFSEELGKLEASVNEITVRINSPGGDVFDGIAIYNRLKQHKAKVVVHIDGLAASIASIIALAGDEIVIGEGALYMVHLPWTMAMGNRTELDHVVNRLLDVEEQLISIYSKKTKKSRTEIKKMLEDETWMDAEQAIKEGFVDSKIEDSLPIAASAISSKWIHRQPKTYKSETAVVAAKIDELKKKIETKLSRK